MHEVAVLGGGVAGLAVQVALRRAGIFATVYERARPGEAGGLGFLLLENGLRSLDALGLGAAVRARGHRIRRCLQRDPGDRLLARSKLHDTYGLRRRDFMDVLRKAAPTNALRTQVRFSHFELGSDRRARVAYFSRGVCVETPLFVAADGVRSTARAALFPDFKLSPVRVQELVCAVYAPDIARAMEGTFLKTQAEEGGLAAGVVPCGGGHVVWYIQYDLARRDSDAGFTPEERRNFACRVVGRWPYPLPELIRVTDFSTAHVWQTTDLNLLPRFHRGNVVLAGDAAHPLLPFTSQGINAALDDALALGRCLTPVWGDGTRAPEPDALDFALQRYSAERRTAVSEYLDAGRRLAERFLYPERFAGEPAVPLAK